MKNLPESIITKALISRVYNYYLWENLYTLHDKTLINVKQVVENYI
jgi:hypothetical protein